METNFCARGSRRGIIRPLDDDDGVMSCSRSPKDRSFGARVLLISFVMPNISMTDAMMIGWMERRGEEKRREEEK
jgi:hypothetical protein